MGTRRPLPTFAKHRIEEALDRLEQAAHAGDKARTYLNGRPRNLDLSEKFLVEMLLCIAEARRELTEARYQRRAPGS